MAHCCIEMRWLTSYQRTDYTSCESGLYLNAGWLAIGVSGCRPKNVMMSYFFHTLNQVQNNIFPDLAHACAPNPSLNVRSIHIMAYDRNK